VYVAAIVCVPRPTHYKALTNEVVCKLSLGLEGIAELVRRACF
jgi:hypothetical protein